MNSVDLIELLASELNLGVDQVSMKPVVGGDINESFVVRQGDENICFLKANDNSRVLQSEYQSLLRLRALGATCFPEAIGFWELETGGAALALEYFPLRPVGNDDAQALARTLLNLHEIGAEDFGWHEDGMIGYSKQFNPRSGDWADFFQRYRIGPQLQMAQAHGLQSSLVERIKEKSKQASENLSQQEPHPSLVHGDLWAGNVAIHAATGLPVLFDPAPYFGDVMTDLAMAGLFGGFPSEFFDYYSLESRKIRQDQTSETKRKSMQSYYNLYHALNHFNMFGGSYESLVARMVEGV